jgi:hypothetical protein
MPGRGARWTGLERAALAGEFPFVGSARRAAGLPLAGAAVRFVFGAGFFAGLEVLRVAIESLGSFACGKRVECGENS